MNPIELSFIFCASLSCFLCCGICLQDIKEKQERAHPHQKINIKAPKFFTSSFSNRSEPLIDSSELGSLRRDTAENITDDEEIRSILRQ